MKITRLDPKTTQPTADSWTLSRTCRQLAIGRTPPADILLDSPDISPKHAELSWQSGSLSIRDLASINGITLRNSRILRASLQDKDIFSVGGMPFLVTVEPADLAARRTHLLLFSGIFLGLVLLAIFVLALILDVKNAKPESPPQELTPLPPVSDTAFQQMSDRYAEASDLLNESRRLIADGLNDLRAAQLLEQAIALNPNLPQATLLLKGLQETHSATIQKSINRLIASGRFQEALDELDRQKALVGMPNAILETQHKIAQRIQYQNAIESMNQGDLDTAESELTALSADVIPERQDALNRLAKCRAAVAWAEQLEDMADQNDLAAVQRLADDEATFSPFLSEDALSEVHGALARARALNDIQKLITTGNAYILVRYIADIPNLSDKLQPLRNALAPQSVSFLNTAQAQVAQTTPSLVPVDLQDALASYHTAQAYASLFIIHPNPGNLQPYRLHSARWNAYLAAITSRATAYIEKGARAEARAILTPLLPYLDDYDAETYPLRNLAVQITPISFSPDTAYLLGNTSATTPPAP